MKKPPRQPSASFVKVARKLWLRVPTSVVPSTSARSSPEVPENPLVTSCPPNKGIGKGRVLVGGELPLPDAVPEGVGTDRPEIGAAAEENAVPEDKNPAVAALHAVEHLDVDGIEPVLRR